jgi:4Fe-4S single cluster domain
MKVSRIHVEAVNQGQQSQSTITRRAQNQSTLASIKALCADDPALAERFRRLYGFGVRIRPSEYHLTNACNIRCEGCWFFEYGHDTDSRENKRTQEWDAFARREAQQRRINSALLIGGEPSLFLDRLAVFVRHMKYVTVSSNGLKPIPVDGFEDVTVALTLFGGGKLDDELRAIKPNGTRFSGLFETALRHYRNDRRAIFIFAVSERGIPYIEDTVHRIADNGNILGFNYYAEYGSGADTVPHAATPRLLDELLRVRDRYPETVLSHPYYLRTMITGRTPFGTFGYAVCPSISVAHPAHAARLQNGHPTLSTFNTWSADTETLKFCCTSGHCNSCRDSQAIMSWLLVSLGHFTSTKADFIMWIEMAESYWSQFIWSPFHRFAGSKSVECNRETSLSLTV